MILMDTMQEMLFYKNFSRTMKESISEKEFIIRFGGEEFLIIMKNPTPEKCKWTCY